MREMIPVEGYVVNLGTRVLHRIPGAEQDNKDQIKRAEHLDAETNIVGYLRDHPDVRACKRCWRSEPAEA